MASLTYINWVRTQPCCACGRPAPSEAHHHTDGRTSIDRPRSKNALGGKRGRGQKADDSETMPLCTKCHGQLHSFSGPVFGDMDGPERRAWQTEQVRLHQERHETETAGQAQESPAAARVLKLEGFDVRAEIETLVTTYQPNGGQLRFDLTRFARNLQEATEKGRAF